MPAQLARDAVGASVGNMRYHSLDCWQRPLPTVGSGPGARRQMPEQVVVVGGGVGGLSAALALGRAGYEVTVVERDPLPATADAEEAFVAERRGAPQAH